MNDVDAQERDGPRRATPEELRGLALWRHYEAAHERAATLVALARYRVADREPLYVLQSRQRHQLNDLLHDFCYHARKTIELAEHYTPGVLERASGMDVKAVGDPISPADKRFLWLLGRIIHSQDILILELEDVEVGTRWATSPRTTSYWTMVSVQVRSDRDAHDEYHNVSIEQLVEAFCRLDDAFRAALDVARRY